MAQSRAKEVSESYKGTEITFDKSVAAAVAKGFTSNDVQAAIIEAKPVAASLAVAGIVRNASDAEVNAGSNVIAFARPDQIRAAMAQYITTNVIPLIPPAVSLPLITYGGQGSLAQMQATYASAPIGSFVVFDEYYTYEVGWGNGSSWVGAYRRRTMCRTNNNGWLMLWA